MTQQPVLFATVCERIVPGGYCSGCGVCAGVCKAGTGAAALRMEWSPSGVPVPVLDRTQCKECGLCLQVCPFWDQNADATRLGQAQFPESSGLVCDPVLGRFSVLYAGYSTVRGHRENGAGGGLATWFLEALLLRGVVDRVACVVPGGDPGTLFRFALLETPEQVRGASRSAYYPVEVSDVIAEMGRKQGRYALVGLPCMLKGIRLAAKALPRLGRRLAMTVGLTCGQARSRFFAEFLCAKCQGDPAAMERARFRVKDPARHHLDHRFECSGVRDGKPFSERIYQTEGMGWLWGHDCFKIEACNFCDDITAELADVSFADAVEEPYCYGNGGANFAIVRSPLARDVLEQGALSGELFLQEVPLDPVRARMTGVELVKRRDLRHRLHLLQGRGESCVPPQRQKPERRDDEAENAWMELRDALRIATTRTYAAHRYAADVVARVERAIAEVLREQQKDGSQ